MSKKEINEKVENKQEKKKEIEVIGINSNNNAKDGFAGDGSEYEEEEDIVTMSTKSISTLANELVTNGSNTNTNKKRKNAHFQSKMNPTWLNGIMRWYTDDYQGKCLKVQALSFDVLNESVEDIVTHIIKHLGNATQNDTNNNTNKLITEKDFSSLVLENNLIEGMFHDIKIIPYKKPSKKIKLNDEENNNSSVHPTSLSSSPINNDNSNTIKSTLVPKKNSSLNSSEEIKDEEGDEEEDDDEEYNEDEEDNEFTKIVGSLDKIENDSIGNESNDVEDNEESSNSKNDSSNDNEKQAQKNIKPHIRIKNN
jgi:hypothetical protein